MKKILAFFMITFLLANTSIAKHYRYISIDSGGMLGLIPASLLADIEQETGKPIHKLVDGMMGTSTGAIIAALLSIPAQDPAAPYSAKAVVEFYKTKATPIFEAATQSIISNKLAQFTRGKTDYSQARSILKTAIDDVFGELKLSESLNNLFILSHDKNVGNIHIFDTKTEKNLLVGDAVLASASIADAFGPTAIQFASGETRNFIDAASMGAKPHVCDPTAYLHQKINKDLEEGDTATIYSLGTGFAPTSQETKRLMAKSNQISIIRIQPEVDHLATMKFMGNLIAQNLLAADTSEETIEGMLEVAESLKTAKEYKRMLSDLKTVALGRNEL